MPYLYSNALSSCFCTVLCQLHTRASLLVKSLICFAPFAVSSQAIMKSFVGSGSDPNRQEKFLAYMVPSADEVDASFNWMLLVICLFVFFSLNIICSLFYASKLLLLHFLLM